MESSGRWVVAALLVVALLAFFFPLVTIQIPILGEQSLSGYDVIARRAQFDQMLDGIGNSSQPAIPNSEQSLASPQLPDSVAPSVAPQDLRSSIPFSVGTLPFVPIEIMVSFGLALIAFIACISGLSSGFLKAVSGVGAFLAVSSVIHLLMANSDLHVWIREVMNANFSSLVNNPFAGLAQRIGNIAVGLFQLKPGAGLYVLAGCLSVATLMQLAVRGDALEIENEPELPRRRDSISLEGHPNAIENTAAAPPKDLRATDCPHCGIRLRQNDRFCSACGYAIYASKSTLV